MLCVKQKYWKGSMTVELAILFPVIFLIILGILSICLTQYQNMVTASAAMQAATRGATYWDKLGGAGAWDFQLSDAETDGGKLVSMDFTDHDPYRYLLDTKKGNRLTNTQAYANWLLGQNVNVTLGEETTSQPKADKTGGFLQKYVTVTVTKQYTNPLGSMLERLGIYSAENRVITASAPLNTPSEFIRNMSFLYDQIHGTGE